MVYGNDNEKSPYSDLIGKRIEEIRRRGGAPWESAYWEDWQEAIDNCPRDRLGGLALRNDPRVVNRVIS